MVKKTVNKELLKRLDRLQSIVNVKSFESIIIGLNDWIESNSDGTFNDYIESKVKNKSQDVTLIIDDMLLSCDLYIPTDLIFDAEKQTVKEFVKAATESNEIRFMELYISLIEEYFDLDVLETDIFSNSKMQFYKDFLEHYKILSIDELVERYKDQKFFHMIKSHK